MALSDFRRELGHRARTAARRMRARLRSRKASEALFRSSYFAEVSVELDGLPEYRVESFPSSGPAPWLDAPDAEERITRRLASGEISPAQAERCREWARSGFTVLPGFFPHGNLDRIWAAYEKAVAAGSVPLQPDEKRANDPYPSRALDGHLRVPEIDGLLRHEALRQWVRLLFGRADVPFQTLISHKGSQQREHSDSIHMTTYPLGYLAAAWVAFEDIHPDSGPVVYYPGSHRLPYLTANSLGITAEEFRKNGYAAYFAKYEPAIQKTILERRLEPRAFLPKKGDVLIWHANLIHAGSPRRDFSKSRKAAVLHYFARGAVCYHDLAGTLTPAARLSRG